MSTQKERDTKLVGSSLAEVLPQTDRWWFQRPNLLRLNLLLLVPLLSSSVSGYDGKETQLCHTPAHNTKRCDADTDVTASLRILDERPAVAAAVA